MEQNASTAMLIAGHAHRLPSAHDVSMATLKTTSNARCARANAARVRTTQPASTASWKDTFSTQQQAYVYHALHQTASHALTTAPAHYAQPTTAFTWTKHYERASQ
jgi:hypothetical protein